MFKKILISLIFILVVAFGGLSYYVSTIDWNRYKDKITTQIEDVTGKKVVINGRVALKFLPTPHLTATDISIYNLNNADKDKPLAQIKEMVTDLSLMPLLRKRFEVDNMNLVDAQILIEFLNNGKTNWFSDVDADQSFNFSGVDIAFNSVMLQNSTVHIINKELNVDVILKKLNADVTAQSLNGPFRIDGNFMKDETPAGFALNLGTLSESFATSLNLVLTHPTSDSYARFDGSVLSNNSEIKGNFSVESQKPSTFLNTISGQVLLPEQYNYPLAASIELTVNPNQVDLSSFIVKYGDHMAGAGRVLIPLKSEGSEKKKIETAFEMTDFDTMPFVAFLKEYLKQFDNTKKPFEPSFEYDVIADVMATRAHYGDEVMRDFRLSADFINNVLTLKNLSAVMPGDTDVAISGDVFENEKILSYDFKVQGASQDFLKFLDFIGHKPEVYAQSTYRNARASFGISGNLNQIKILPFDFSFDKIEMTGALGVKRDRRNSVFASIQSESINFDNYFPQESEDDKNVPLIQKITKFLNGFKFLNDTDVQAELNLKLGIYHKVPFENLTLNMNSTAGKVELKKLDIEQIASAHLQLQGNVSNLAITPTFENLKYGIETSDFASFINKTGIKFPEWPLFKTARNMSLDGVLTGTLENSNIKFNSKIEKLSTTYEGRLYRQDDKTYWSGQIEVKAPDFIEFSNQLNLDYNPINLAASIFNFKSKLEGSFSNWRATDMNAFIGPNNFTGAFAYHKATNKPEIKANVSANIFEFDRFIFAPEKKKNVRSRKTVASFLEKPEWDKTGVDYETFKKFDLSGKFNIKNLSYLNDDIENVNFLLNIKNGFIDVKDFTATKNEAPIKSDFSIDITSKPTIKGSLEVSNYPLEKFGGSTYSIEKGTMGFKAQFEGSAASEAEFIKTAKANVSFDVIKATVKGLDVEMIEDDLSKRTHSENLDTFLEKNLSSGESSFDSLGGDITIENATYNIKNAVFTSAVSTIDWSASGSLENWDVNATFNTIFERIKDDVLPFDFKFDGSLSNPHLVVDASALKNKYDSHWAQIAEEKRLREENRLKQLRDRMAQEQKVVDEQTDLITSEILPRIERYRPESFDVRVSNIYDSISIQADDIFSKLKELKAVSYKEYTHENIDNIKLQTDVYAPLLPELITKLDENYIFDLKLHIADALKTISAIYQNSSEKSSNYQNTLNAYTMRLMQLGSIVSLSDMEEVKTGRNTIETSIKEISDIYNQALKIAESSDEEKQIILLDKNNKNIQKLKEDAKTKLDLLNNALEDLFEYVQDVVYFEQTGKHKTAPKEELKVTSQDESAEVVTEKPSEKGVQEQENNKEESLVVTPVKEETNTPKKFIPKDETITETIVVETPHEEVQEIEEISKPVIEVVEEKVVEPAKPLLVVPEDDYASRIVPSGQIVRKGSKAIALPQKEEEASSLLKPIEGEVLIEGSITRK